MPLADTQALIAERGDRDDMPTEYKRRLLAAMRKEHVRTTQFIQRLKEDIAQTAEQGDFEQASIKWTVLTRLLSRDAEFCFLMGKLAAETEAAAQSAIAVTIASPGCVRC